jgi:hypothetical protein
MEVVQENGSGEGNGIKGGSGDALVLRENLRGVLLIGMAAWLLPKSQLVAVCEWVAGVAAAIGSKEYGLPPGPATLPPE